MKMKQAEYFARLQRITKLEREGEITPDEARELLHEVNNLYKKNVSKEDTDRVIDAILDGLPVDAAEKHVGIGQPKQRGSRGKAPEEKPGNDPGTRAADEAVSKIEREIKDVYQQAAKEMQAKLNQVVKENKETLDQLYADKAAGLITQADIDRWVEQQNHRTKQMEDKLDQIAGVMTHANEKALGMINGATLGVFAENATFQNYQLARNTGMNLMFSVYDENAVKRLIKEDPELLPRKVVNGRKDQAWNQRIISNALKQAIIQGESIPTLARRIAAATASSNNDAMVRYARTAMTSAQNAGRQEMLHQAKQLGVKCKKVWLATLDSRTRDAHAKLDGQKVDIDKPFKTDMGDLMYPGDMGSSGSVPANLYNCRCTMVYEYEGFPGNPDEDLRRDNETGELIKNMTYDEWKKMKNPDNPQPGPEPSKLQKKVDKAKQNTGHGGIISDYDTLVEKINAMESAGTEYEEEKKNLLPLADKEEAATEIYMGIPEDERKKLGQLTTLDISQLKTEQEFVFTDRLEDIAEQFGDRIISGDPEKNKYGDGITVALYKGEYIVLDGNNRTNLAILKGQEKIDVMVVDLDARIAAQEKTALQDLKDTINSHEGTWTEKELRETGAKAAKALEESRKEKGYYEQQEKVEKANAEEKESFQKYCAASRDFYKTKKDAPDFDEKKRRMEEANREYRAAEKVTRDARKELEEREASVFELVAKVRRCGGFTEEDAGLDFSMAAGDKKKLTKNIMQAINLYPTDWTVASAEHWRTLKPVWDEGRASYTTSTGRIKISAKEATNIHELAHRYEATVPGILEAEREFYERRTAGEQAKWLGGVYDRDEVTRKDKFIDKYMGKDYGGEAYELCSMGIELARKNYKKLCQDEEFRDFILGVLCGV